MSLFLSLLRKALIIIGITIGIGALLVATSLLVQTYLWAKHVWILYVVLFFILVTVAIKKKHKNAPAKVVASQVAGSAAMVFLGIILLLFGVIFVSAFLYELF